MSGNKKVTIKSLSDELSIVKEDLKEMHSLREKVKELEKYIVTLKNGGADQQEADQDSQSIECRNCKRSFPSKKHLKEQIFVSHPKKIFVIIVKEHSQATMS